MTQTLSSITALIEAKLQDAKPFIATYSSRGLSSAALVSSFITSQLKELSKFAPRKIVDTFAGAGTAIYQLEGVTTYVASWTADFSRIVNLAYPYDATNDEVIIPNLAEDYQVERRLFGSTTAEALIFNYSEPAAGDTIWLEYTALQLCDTTCTISDADADAFACLVAGKYLKEAVGPALFRTISNNPVADAVSYKTDGERAMAAGQRLIDAFYEHFGADPKNRAEKSIEVIEYNLMRERGYTFHK